MFDDKAFYSYDAFNRTAKVETFDGNIQINRYDAEGLRHEMEENGTLVQFIFNLDREVVTEQSGGSLNRFIRGTELIARSCDSARTYYHYASDELGSVTHIVDESGVVCNRYAYDAWGRIVSQDEAVPNRFKFTGQQLDPVTQQYYLRARFYNPVVARFTQEDTYRGDGLNLYAYCANNPVVYVDPSGHVAKCLKNAFDKYRLQGEDINTAYALARKDYEAAKQRGEKVPTPEKPSNAAFKEHVRREREFIRTSTKNEVQAAIQQYQFLVNQIDSQVRASQVNRFTLRRHGTLVHKKVREEMEKWLATQSLHFISVNMERAYSGGKPIIGNISKQPRGYSKPDLVIRECHTSKCYIGDIKTGNAQYGKTQMAKNQGNVMGVSTTTKAAHPDVIHLQFKPGELQPEQRYF